MQKMTLFKSLLLNPLLVASSNHLSIKITANCESIFDENNKFWSINSLCMDFFFMENKIPSVSYQICKVMDHNILKMCNTKIITYWGIVERTITIWKIFSPPNF